MEQRQTPTRRQAFDAGVEAAGRPHSASERQITGDRAGRGTSCATLKRSRVASPCIQLPRRRCRVHHIRPRVR